MVEKRTKTQDKVNATKQGQIVTPEGIEDFTETFWETPTAFGKEKTWVRGSAKGEEKEYKDGDKKWGESWTNDINYEAKKKWHEEGSHKWGEGEGVNGYETWKENWDKNSQGSFEETNVVDRSILHGKIRKRSKSNSYVVEWEGLKPEVIVPDEEDDEGEDKDQKGTQNKAIKKPIAKKLRSGRPQESEFPRSKTSADNLESDPKSSQKASETEQIGYQLFGLFNILKNDIKDRVKELSNSDSSKFIEPVLSNILLELSNIQDPGAFSPAESLSGINLLKDLNKKLNEAEGQILNLQPSIDQLNNLFAESLASASSLKNILDPSNLSDTLSELSKLSREFELAVAPKDKILLISSVDLIIKYLIRANKNEVEDSAKETSEITGKLQNYLKSFEESIQESQNTLQLILKNFRPNDESINPITLAYIDRSREVIQNIEQSFPYTQTIPKVSSLITDIERFKRELVNTDLNNRLKKLLESSLASDLANALNVPGVIKKDEELPNSLAELVEKLEKQNEIVSALANKIIGNDVVTGDPELDKIPFKDPKQSVLPIDPLALLKYFWVAGKEESDAFNKLLSSLAETLGDDDEKTQANEIAETGQKALSGVIPEDSHSALEQLKLSIEEYLPNKQNLSNLLQTLFEKADNKIKETEVKPEGFEDL